MKDFAFVKCVTDNDQSIIVLAEQVGNFDKTIKRSDTNTG